MAPFVSGATPKRLRQSKFEFYVADSFMNDRIFREGKKIANPFFAVCESLPLLYGFASSAVIDLLEQSNRHLPCNQQGDINLESFLFGPKAIRESNFLSLCIRAGKQSAAKSLARFIQFADQGANAAKFGRDFDRR